MRHSGLFMALCLTWGVAQSKDLVEVYQLALDNDPIYKAQEAQFQAQKQVFPQALAQYLPNLSAQVSTTGNRSNLFAYDSTYNSKNYTLTLTQPVFRVDLLAGLENARHTEKQALALFIAAGQDLILRVCEQYFAILTAQDAVFFAKSQVIDFARQYEQTKQRFDVGLIAITDVLESKARHDSAVSRQYEAENNLANQYEILRQITAIPVDNIAGLAVSDQKLLQSPIPNDQEEWVRTAQVNNLEIQAAKEAALIAKSNIGASTAGYFPSVNVTGSATRAVQGPPYTDPYTQESLNLTVNIPIYAGGGTNASIRQAQALYRESLDDLDAQRKETYSETRQKFRGILTLISQVRSLSQAVISNSSALEATKASYDVGTRTIVDVLDAESNLLEAQANHAKARYLYVVEGLKLKRAAGILNLEDLMAVNTLLYNG